MKKALFLPVIFLIIVTSLFAQSVNLKKGWNLIGITENQVSISQFANDSDIKSIWQYDSSGNWKLWSSDKDMLSMLDEDMKIYDLYDGDAVWVYSEKEKAINIKGYCPANYIPIATESYNYQTGGYSVVSLNDFKVYKNLNTYTLGGDIRTYFYNGYIFTVDAPNSGNIATFYVYKVGSGDFDENSGKNVISNYNINRQNPHSITFKSLEKAYLTTYFDNDILIFNPLTGKTLGTIDLKSYLYISNDGTKNKYIGAEHMIKYKNKLFITLDRARTYYGDTQPDKSMIIVVNMENDKIEKAIEIPYSPRSPQIYKDYLYFLSMGDYKNPIGTIYRINLSNLELDKNFKISPVETEDNEKEFIKNFVITPEGEVFIVCNAGWGKPYNVYRILNVELYDDTNKTGLIKTPVYSASSYIPDIDYDCGYIVIADRGKADIDYKTKEVKEVITPGSLVFLDKNGNIVQKISDTSLGYPPYKIGTDPNY